MKQLLFCAVVLINSVVTVQACDVCGCSSGSQGLGLLPQFNKHFVGIQYLNQQFRSTHYPLSGDQPATTSNEYFNTIQVWGRYYLGKRWQLFAFLPYRSTLTTAYDPAVNISGLGDASMLVNYTFLQTPDSSDAIIRQRLQAGGGVKAPTGKYSGVMTLETQGLPTMQPGTGSWDFPVNLNYTVKYRNTGVNLDASYSFTTANKHNYKYGNRLATQLTCFYWLRSNKLSVLPQAGIRYEYTLHDYDNYARKWLNSQTGGSLLFMQAGMQIYYGIAGIRVSYGLPIVQNYAMGNVQAKQRLDAGLMFLF